MRIVIDTNIWVNSFCDFDNPANLDCMGFLLNFQQNQNYKLAVDYERCIENEYNRYIREMPSARELLKGLYRQNRVEHGPSGIPQKMHDRLLEMGFHEPEDHVFLGTAYHSDKILVSEDSDYGTRGQIEKQRIRQYIQEIMGVRLYNGEEARRESYPGNP